MSLCFELAKQAAQMDRMLVRLTRFMEGRVWILDQNLAGWELAVL